MGKSLELSEKYPWMNWEELTKKYPNSWLLLFNPISKNIGLKAESGYFAYKSKSKAKLVQKSLDKSLWENVENVKSIGIFYTGTLKLPKNHVICLGL